jgi:hypothetical protein
MSENQTRVPIKHITAQHVSSVQQLLLQLLGCLRRKLAACTAAVKPIAANESQNCM